jgi:hypothetical protein
MAVHHDEDRMDLVGRFANSLTYAAVLFRAAGVARALQIHADMRGARVLAAQKNPSPPT